MSFLENALATVDAVAAREIVDPDKFRDGISKIIDGTVECLNASTWAKGGAAKPADCQLTALNESRFTQIHLPQRAQGNTEYPAFSRLLRSKSRESFLPSP